MSAAECIELLDAVLRSSSPTAYAKGVEMAYMDAGWEWDALTAAAIAELHRAGEIELLMHIRAEWSGQRTLARTRSTKPT